MSKLSEKAYRLITGISINKEYVGVAHNLENQLNVYLTGADMDFFLSIPKHLLLFLGFSPLIIGFSREALGEHELTLKKGLCFSFHEGDFKSDLMWRNYPASSMSAGRIELKFIQSVQVDSEDVYLFEGISATYQFLPRIYRTVHIVRNYFRNRPGNVKPSPSLYAQLIAAYSIPRFLSVLSTGANNLFNIFPIDLDGYVGQKHFVFCLRLKSKANKAVEQSGKVALARVALSSKEDVFKWGKNHMEEMKPETAFEFEKLFTKKYGFLLPRFSTRYIEMELVSSCDYGIHRIHFCRIIHEESVRDGQPELSLIHRYYAQWRIKKGQQTDYV